MGLRGWWSRLWRDLREPGDRGWLRRDGHDLKWPRTSLPLPVLYAPSAEPFVGDVLACCRQLNAQLQGSAVMLPDPVISELYDQFYEPKALVRNLILVELAGHTRKVPLHGSIGLDDGDPKDGHCDIRYDRRTGAILNARILIPQGFGAYRLQERHAILLHEFCHALGLGHDDDHATRSIMHPDRITRPQLLYTGDVERLRAAYLTAPAPR